MAKMINYSQLKERMTTTQEKGQPLTDLNKIQNMVSYLYRQNVFRGKELETFSISSNPENINDLLKVCNEKSQSIKNGLHTMVQKDMDKFSDLFKNIPATEKLECLDYVSLITRSNIESKVLEAIPQRDVSFLLYQSSYDLSSNRELMQELSKEMQSLEKLGTTAVDNARKQEIFKELAALKFNSYDKIFQSKDKLQNSVEFITEEVLKNPDIRKDFLACVVNSYSQKNLFIDNVTGELNEDKFRSFVKKSVTNKLVSEYAKSFYNKEVGILGLKNAVENKSLNKSLHDKLKEVHNEELGYDLFRILAVSLKHYVNNYAKANYLDTMKDAVKENNYQKIHSEVIKNIPKEYMPDFLESAMKAGISKEMLEGAGVDKDVLDKVSKNETHKADVKEFGKQAVVDQENTAGPTKSKSQGKGKSKSQGKGMEM